MAVLARAIIYGEPSHYAIYAQKEFLWNNIKQPNRNLLLWRDKTVDGLRPATPTKPATAWWLPRYATASA